MPQFRIQSPLTCVKVIFMTACIAATAHATLVFQTGAGVRSFALANNYTAMPSGVSGLYFNPAALGFLSSSQASFSVDWINNLVNTAYFGTADSAGRQSVRILNAGLAMKVPTSVGGLGFGAAYQSPLSFADQLTYQGQYLQGGSLVQESKDYHAAGSLDFWSVGGGVQVAEGLSLGGSISLVTGREDVLVQYSRFTNGIILDSVNDDYSASIERDYLGFDFRVGVLYEPTKLFRIGLMIAVPAVERFSETDDESFPLLDSTDSFTSNGQLESSFSGALGVAVPLQFLTLAVDARFRAPYNGQPDNSDASRWRMGAGLGVEVPIRVIGLVARAGYSYDQFDPYEFLFKYDYSAADVVPYTAVQDRQLVSGGLEYSPTRRVSFEAAYGYSFWKLSTDAVLLEMHHLHRVVVGMTIRY